MSAVCLLDAPHSWRKGGRRRPTSCGVSCDEVLSSTGHTSSCTSDDHSLIDELSSDEAPTPHADGGRPNLWIDVSSPPPIVSPLSVGLALEIPVSPPVYTLTGAADQPRRKSVGWATPTSLHDTKIITPANHPNRRGQFWTNDAQTDSARSSFFDFLWSPSFKGAVGEVAEVALMDGLETIGWLPCEINVANNDGTYDITILPSALSDEHDVVHQSAYAVSHQHMRRAQ